MSGSKPALLPSARLAANRPDVWTFINQTAAQCKVPPVSLSQGFFNYNPPQFILDAAKRAIDDVSCNQYQHTRGRLNLRKQLSKTYSPLYNRELDPESQILVTTGANEGFLSAFAAFLNPGDEVIVMEPFFDQYISNITMYGGVPVYVPIIPPAAGSERPVSASEWKLDMQRLRAAITSKTRMLVINTPHNPLGKVFSREELLEIADVVLENNLVVVSDEVYERLTYVDEFPRLATLRPELFKHVIAVGSAGKTFGVTGWRIGWLIGDAHLIKYCSAAHTRICFATNGPMQQAIADSLAVADQYNYFSEYVDSYKKRFRVLADVFDELGLPYSQPEGTYYTMVNFSKVKVPEDYPVPDAIKDRPRDFKIALWLMKEIGIATIPPTEFFTDEDAHIADTYLRFAFCKTFDELEEGARRLRKLKEYM
ncbi:aminotransferase class I and II [Schizosaccharomyces japonicus yFS275]|uniref:Aminotransferase class I and II n=1 Tax=Schizosaccharomyces japonicus (strain yFS275 / FY16936) TaxID=402676 RepID=B6K8B1_SCHJY|nr:aminotransferase class I and II [Schizosaccharomyces japonicus yFS275]EEB09765.1 aminotransferase class I and II [Schizosaccharomyces japonicus yFS275]